MSVAPLLDDPGTTCSPETAVSDLYERYRAQIYRFCLRELRSPEEAEDATQSTFLNALRGLHRGVQPELESAWLYAIAQNVCRTRRRASWRRGRVERPDDLDTLEQVVAAPGPVAREELMGLSAALESMPESQRQAILLREWKGLSYDEIGEEMGLSHSAVETLIFRARRRLARGLEQVQPKRLRQIADGGGLLALLKALLGAGAAGKAVATGAAALLIGGSVLAGEQIAQRQAPAKAPAAQVQQAAPHAAPASFAGAAPAGPGIAAAVRAAAVALVSSSSSTAHASKARARTRVSAHAPSVNTAARPLPPAGVAPVLGAGPSASEIGHVEHGAPAAPPGQVKKQAGEPGARPRGGPATDKQSPAKGQQKAQPAKPEKAKAEKTPKPEPASQKPPVPPGQSQGANANGQAGAQATGSVGGDASAGGSNGKASGSAGVGGSTGNADNAHSASVSGDGATNTATGSSSGSAKAK